MGFLVSGSAAVIPRAARVRVALAATLLVAACGSNEAAGPWDRLPLDGTFDVDVAGRVDVARDQQGTLHIRARSLADLAYVQGYTTAHDRLVQMDLLRRIGRGTLAELYGLDANAELVGAIVDSDLAMRVHQISLYAEQTWLEYTARAEAIGGSPDADDDTVTLLGNFARGVNQYVAHLNDGTWGLSPELAAIYQPEFFRTWTPQDSIVIARLYALASSNTVPFELELTDLYQRLQASFDPATARDLLALVPVGDTSTIAGFPNQTPETDTGTESNDPTPKTAAARPQVSARALAGARALFATLEGVMPAGALGSNSFAVDATRTAGSAFLATDLQMPAQLPNAFYPTHLTIVEAVANPDDETADPIDVPVIDLVGLTLPGIPAIVVGTNGALAWAPSPSNVDLNDVYRETVVECVAPPTNKCTLSRGNQLAIDERLETIQLGRRGRIERMQTERYYSVANHGPVLPVIASDHTLAELDDANTLTVRHAAYRSTYEIRGLWKLATATDFAAAFRALDDLDATGLSWLFLDGTRQLAWSQHAAIPQREDAVYAWDAIANPTAPAPFFVLDGSGDQDWDEDGTSFVLPRYIPHAIAPATLVTTGADPVGVTFDGNPLNQVAANDAPLYIGVAFDNGLRQAHLASVLANGDGPLQRAELEALQHDSTSLVGAALQPALASALAFVANPDGAPTDARAFLNALSPEDAFRLQRAYDLVASWRFATPVENVDTDRASATTILFNTWLHDFLVRALDDEITALGNGWTVARLGADRQLRLVHALLVTPARLVQHPTTNQPALCDRSATAGADSCTTLVLAAMLAAMTELEVAFATDDVAQWHWGARHPLTFTSFVPGLPVPAAIPREGDTFSIDRGDAGWSDLDFAQTFASAYRIVAEAAPGRRIQLRWTFAGGSMLDPRTEHATDRLPDYLSEVHRDVPYELADIVANGETRWEFR